MRSEKEMLSLIIQTAEQDPRIRAAYLEGSRANPNIPKDLFQDYDVAYVVTETASFRQDRKWIDRFGDRMYMQYPEEGIWADTDIDSCYGWLIQFKDGNRLDLHVRTEQNALENLELYRALVDKDGILPAPQMTSDQRYWIQKPTQEMFSCACNEFWWCLNNAAKGLWRREILYVMDVVHFQVRPMLVQLLAWKIGMEQNFSVNIGKSAKYMERYLPKALYSSYLSTYSRAETAEIWDSIFLMCDLFGQTARELSAGLGFSYQSDEEEGSRAHLLRVRNLPRDAEEII